MFDLTAVQDGLAQLASPRVEHATGLLLNTISVGSFVLVGGAIVAFALARRRPDIATACAVLLCGSVATSELLKHRLPPRPGVPSHLARSFPSGHATIALSLGLALVLVAPASMRVAAAAAAVVYATAIGAALVVGGWHFPSDVGGGFCVATAWAAAVSLPGLRASSARPPLGLLGAAVAAVLVAAVVAALARHGLVEHVRLHLRFVEAAVGILATAAVCVGAFAYAIAPRSASTTRS